MLWCPCQKSWNRPRHSLKLGDIEIVSSVNVSIRIAVEILLDQPPFYFWRGAGVVVCLFCFTLFFVCLFVLFFVVVGFWVEFFGGVLCVFLCCLASKSSFYAPVVAVICLGIGTVISTGMILCISVSKRLAKLVLSPCLRPTHIFRYCL